jgi:hypothetical protein
MITRSAETVVESRIRNEVVSSPERRRELPFLLCASLLVIAGLALVYTGKTQNFVADAARLKSGELLNLNANPTSGQIAPLLLNIPDSEERTSAAERVRDYLSNLKGPVPNVGALAKLRKKPKVALLSIGKIKSSFVVRTPEEYRTLFLTWCGIYLGSFWLVHLLWRWRRFAGDPAILPALQLLTGMGLILAVSLRDPLRDSLDFRKFAWGCAAGCLMLLLPLFKPFQYRHFSGFVYTPLLVSVALFGLLVVLGSGPTGGSHQSTAGVLSCRLLFTPLGMAARVARTQAGTGLDQVAGDPPDLANVAGNGWCNHRARYVFRFERHGARAGLRDAVSGYVRGGSGTFRTCAVGNSFVTGWS